MNKLERFLYYTILVSGTLLAGLMLVFTFTGSPDCFWIGFTIIILTGWVSATFKPDKKIFQDRQQWKHK